MITIDEAINLIEYALCTTGVNVIPNIQSFRIADLFEIYKHRFGLQYDIGSPRISEKIHEMMFSSEESSRVEHAGNYFLMHYKNVHNKQLPFNEFTSDKVLVTKNNLIQLLETYEYFNPRA
jgi:UDP-glucose 4-epimerase